LFKIHPKSKIIFWASNHIESSMFQVFWTRFNPQKITFPPLPAMGDQSILAKMNVKESFKNAYWAHLRLE